MTPSLRRAHGVVWLLLAIALPVIFVAALLAYRSPLEQEPIGRLSPAPLPVLIRSAMTDSLDVTLRQGIQGAGQQVEIRVKRSFAVPSAVVRIRERGAWRAIGLLDAPGVYRFPVTTVGNPVRIEIVDNVHGRLLRTIQL